METGESLAMELSGGLPTAVEVKLSPIHEGMLEVVQLFHKRHFTRSIVGIGADCWRLSQLQLFDLALHRIEGESKS